MLNFCKRHEGFFEYPTKLSYCAACRETMKAVREEEQARLEREERRRLANEAREAKLRKEERQIEKRGKRKEQDRFFDRMRIIDEAGPLYIEYHICPQWLPALARARKRHPNRKFKTEKLDYATFDVIRGRYARRYIPPGGYQVWRTK